MKYESIIEKLEELQPQVGWELDSKFDKNLQVAIKALVDDLAFSDMDDKAKVQYAAYMFSKTLADLADLLEPPVVYN